jgi:hypothetical protein
MNIPLLGGQVASPSLEGGQVAVLRRYVWFLSHLTGASYSLWCGQRIPQMSDFCCIA